MTDWKEALAPSPECIDLVRLGEELSDAERAHVDGCARCQTELALFREIANDETSSDEAREVEWIASELRRRNNVVAFRPKSWRVLYAVAAALVMVIGISYWINFREPAVDTTFDPSEAYRTARLDVIAPIGELAQAPNELRWTAVEDASRYRVQIAEVDGTLLWSAGTTQSNVALPPAVIAQFAPGKSLLWEVKAFRGDEMLASSDTQTVRVSVAPLRKTR